MPEEYNFTSLVPYKVLGILMVLASSAVTISAIVVGFEWVWNQFAP